MYAGLSRDHTRQKRKVLTNHLVQACISQMRERGEARADLPTVSRPVGGRTSTGTPRWQPWALRSRRLPRPPAWPDPRALESLGGRAHMPGSLPTVGRLRAGPWPRLARSADLDGRPRPAHLSRTARAAATPPAGPGVRPASTAPGTGCGARRAVRRPEGRGRYLKWALSSRRGRPRRPGACRRRGRSRRCGSATAAPVYTPPREDADWPVT